MHACRRGFDAEDSEAACQDDENCGEVPGMSGLGEAVFDPKEEHCDARLGTLVNGVRLFPSCEFQAS